MWRAMSDMLERWMMLNPRRSLLHHLVLIGCSSGLVCLVAALIVIIVVSSAALVREVCRTLVLMRAAIVLESPYRLVDVS